MKKDDRIQFTAFSLIRSWRGVVDEFHLEHMAGDASGRQYYRVVFEAGGTCIVMITSDTASQEFGRGNQFDDFIAMNRMLRDTDIPVPRVINDDRDLGAMLLEDLGDVTLYSMIRTAPEEKYRYVRAAVDLLIDWQHKIWNRTDCSSPADARSFTAVMFMNEFYHFHEYMVEKRVHHPSWESLWKETRPVFSELVSEIMSIPFILSHRDFQSKNIMVRGEDLFIIDHQDALLAPVVYDLTALLRDSYIQLSDEELQALLDHYWNNSDTVREIIQDRTLFERRFHLQTVQRKMKDAGRFIYINQVRNNSSFLPFVKPSLIYVRDALLKLDDHRLIDAYKPFISEFAGVGTVRT